MTETIFSKVHAMNFFSSSYAADALQKRLLIARVQLADLDTPSASIVRLDEVSDMENVHPVTFLDLPDGYAISTDGLPKDGMTVRMLDILAVEPLRGQQQSDAMQRDYAANMMLMLMLAKHRGYSSITAGIQDNFDKSKLYRNEDGFREMKTFADIDASLDKFFDTLVACDWHRGGNVYLTRQAPANINDFDPQPFEITVHRNLIGWKLPEHLVNACLEGAKQRAGEAANQYRQRQSA